jgi:signal transduction histidine kinase
MTRQQATSHQLPTGVRWAALAVLALFLAAGVVPRLADRPALTLAGAAVALVGGGVAFFSRNQWWFLSAAAVSTAGTAVLGHGRSSDMCWFALCLLACWCALSASAVVIGVFWSGAMLLLVFERLVGTPDAGWFAWIAGTSFSIVACLFGRQQRDLVLKLREAQAGLAQRAQAEERSRIARELHDVIAHSLTVSLLHVSSARLAVRDDPADADRALAEAERLGRASLEEVRHAVGTLHRDDAVDPTRPLPGSTDVPALIEGFRAAGADIRADIDEDVAQLPAMVGLATYRILQEALTNATRHAPRSPVAVHVAVEPGVVRLDVDSAGVPGAGAGRGLLGMRERAASLGGLCEAGPSGSGWLVHAELPSESGPER